MKTFTKSNFAADVLGSSKPVVIDFWATWCGPCRMLAPTMEELERDNPGVTFGKVNVDEEVELAVQFGITSIPAIMVFKDGKRVAATVGYQPKAQLQKLVDQA